MISWIRRRSRRASWSLNRLRSVFIVFWTRPRRCSRCGRASGESCSLAALRPKSPIGLVGDQVRLRQVLLNLGGNGIKFTESGEVTVSVRVESQEAEQACLEFAVQDTGIGIPRSDLENIFRPFTQADSSTTRRFGGTGLGLAITSSLVRMMGGRIWVESEQGHGSTFYFTVRMPLAKEPPAVPIALDVLPSATSALRILLVEDNPANQKFAAYILGERGHTVEIAGEGHQGLSMAQQNHYDVILMDVQMPGMDGLEVTQGNPHTRRWPTAGADHRHDRTRDERRPRAVPCSRYGRLPVEAHRRPRNDRRDRKPGRRGNSTRTRPRPGRTRERFGCGCLRPQVGANAVRQQPNHAPRHDPMLL